MKNIRANEGKSFGRFMEQYWLLFFTILLALVVGIIENSFFKITNLMNILSTASLAAIAAIGFLSINIVGEIDFSIGEQVTCGGVCMCLLLRNPPFEGHYVLTFIVTILIVMGIGAFNAFMHVGIGIPAFIATMGTSYILGGICKMVLNFKTVSADPSWPDFFTFLGQHYIGGVIPIPVIIMIVLAVLMYIFLERTRTGRYMYAVGANINACKYFGINDRREKIKGFLICSAFAALNGILLSSKLNGISPNSGGATMFNSMTIIMLGSVFIKRGVFNVPGTVLSAILMAIIDYGTTMVGLSSYFRELLRGGILIFAIIFATVLRNRVISAASSGSKEVATEEEKAQGEA